MPRRTRGPVERDTYKTIRDLPRVNPAHDSLAATALVLAKALDDGAGLATAAVARELRATMGALTLTTEGGGQDDGFRAFVADLGVPPAVEHTP